MSVYGYRIFLGFWLYVAAGKDELFILYMNVLEF